MYWSPSSISALAEAELEYVDDHKSQSVYVALPVEVCSPGLERILPSGSDAPSLLIWTTTPWTLPANMAVTVHAEIMYRVVRCQDDRLFVVAEARIEDLGGAGIFGEDWVILGEVSGTHLWIILTSPLY